MCREREREERETESGVRTEKFGKFGNWSLINQSHYCLGKVETRRSRDRTSIVSTVLDLFGVMLSPTEDVRLGERTRYFVT